MRKMLILAVAAFAMSACADPVRVLFDTDMYTDYDDVGALAILNVLADAGECELLAVGCNTYGEGNRSVAACEIINAYFGRGVVPVGCSRVGGKVGAGACGFGLPEKYPESVRHLVSTNAPAATEIYRQALANSPDKSVVLCSVGFLNNVAALLESDRELVASKIRLWVCMACAYPKGQEYNSKTDPESSQRAFESWPRDIPIIFTDFQYGRHCYSGRAVADLPDGRNPVRDAFARMLTPRDKVERGHSWDQYEGHPSWDETAALIAVRGWEKYFNLEHGYFRMVGTDGADEWVADETALGGRVTERLSRDEVGGILDRLMCRQPLHPWGK